MELREATGRAASVPPDLDRHKYLSLTTYRRDGRGVATPVWFAVDGETVYVHTGDTTGKARRLRRDPRVTLGPSDARGRLLGAAFAGVAAVASEEDARRIERLFDRKYPVAKRVLTPLGGLLARLGRRSTGHAIFLAITPDGRERFPWPPR